MRLTFQNGKVAKAEAEKGREFLQAMIAMDAGAAYLCEAAIGTNYGITEVKNPKKRMPPERALYVPPKLLSGETPQLDPEVLPLRPMLADWLTSRDNPWL